MEDVIDTDLPSRLFALDHYPTVTKINAYSKPEWLATIATALDGTDQMNWLLASPFGKLFTIPPNRCSFSGKLVLGMVSRQLVTKKKREMWFVFAGHPIRFGLREFAMLTGLECGKYPKKRAVEEVVKTKEGCNTVWSEIFEEDENPTVADLVKKLEGEQMDAWKKLTLSLIIIVDGILTCYTQPVKPSKKTVEMTKNIEFFSRYPWGRMSFSRTLETISGFRTDEDVENIVASLKQTSLVCHGFPLAIQLLAFKAVPSLCKLLPPDEGGPARFTKRSIHDLANLRPIRTASILQCEAAKDVEVRCIIESEDPISEDDFVWKDEREDPKVDYMLNLINSDHNWEETTWGGGDDECEKQIRPGEKGKGIVGKRKRGVGATVGRMKQKSSASVADESNANVFGDEDDKFEPFVVELRRFFRKQTVQQEKFKNDVKVFIRQEIQAAFAANRTTTPLKSSGKKKRRIITLSNAGRRRKSERLKTKTSSLQPPTHPAESVYQKENPGIDIGTDGNDGEDSSTNHETLQDDEEIDFLNTEEGKDVQDGSVKDQKSGNEEMADIGTNSPQDKPRDGDDVFYDAPDGGKESKGEDAHLLDPDSPTNIVRNVLFGLSSTTGVHDTLHPTPDDEGVLGAAQNSGFCNLNVNFANTASDQSDIQGGLAPPEQSSAKVDGSTQVDPPSESDGGSPQTNKEAHVPGPSDVTVTFDPTHVEGGVAPSDHGASVDPSTQVDANLKSTITDGGVDSSDTPGSSNPGVDVAKSVPKEANIQDLNEVAVEDDNSQADVDPKTSGQFVTKKVYVIDDTPGTSNLITEDTITVPFKEKEPEILVTAGAVTYHPMDKVEEGKFSRLQDVLAGADVIPPLFGYHPVTKYFFSILAKPGEWVQSGHIDMMAQLLWRKSGEAMITSRAIIADSFLTAELQRRFHDFSMCKKKEGFPWGEVLLDICKGERMHRTPKLQWMKDVDILYAPMNWKQEHWVGLLINLKEKVVNIFDPLLIHTRETVVKKRIQPIMEMIPYLVKAGCKDFIPNDYPVKPFSYYRIPGISQNERTGDCGPFSMKFLELQCLRMPLQDLSCIEEADVDNFRKMFALEIYEHGVGPLA